MSHHKKDKGLWEFRKRRDGESEKSLSQTGHALGSEGKAGLGYVETG